MPYPYFRSGPFVLLLDDILLIGRLTPHLLFLLWPAYWFAQPSSNELAITFSNLLACVEQLLLLLMSIVSIGISLFILLSPAPTFAFLAWILLCITAFVGHALVMQDGAIVKSSKRFDVKRKHEDETWLFVNGICTGTHWIQANVDLLSKLFGRDVVGVRNKTYGFIFDLIQCILMRNFLHPTLECAPTLYARIVQALRSESKTKVVVVAHSQGAIITSLVLDQIIVDMDAKYLKKLEIYTFGNAANHFNSPRDDGQHLFSIAEHLANGKDFVAGLGVLNWQTNPTSLENNFFGRLFVRELTTGHLLNMHYLDPPAWPTDVQGERSRLWSYLA